MSHEDENKLVLILAEFVNGGGIAETPLPYGRFRPLAKEILSNILPYQPQAKVITEGQISRIIKDTAEIGGDLYARVDNPEEIAEAIHAALPPDQSVRIKEMEAEIGAYKSLVSKLRTMLSEINYTSDKALAEINAGKGE